MHEDATTGGSTPDHAAPVGTAHRAAKREGLVLGLAVGVYGVSFGAIAVTAGLDVWQTVFLSLVMFTGGSQFAFVGVVAAGGVAAIPAAIASAVMLGARNLIYGIRLQPILDLAWSRRGWPRALGAAWITIDESIAVALAQQERSAQRTGFWVTGVAIFCCWNLTTLLGALLGDVIGDPRTFGLDAVAAAAFLGLLWPRLKSLQGAAVGAGAAVLTVVLIPNLPVGVPVLIAALVALVVGITNWFGREQATS